MSLRLNTSRACAVHVVILRCTNVFGQMTNDQDDVFQPRITECPSGQVIDRLVTGLSRIDNRKDCCQLGIAGQTNRIRI